MQKNKTGPLSYTIHKNKLKNRKNIGSNLLDITPSNMFMGMSPPARKQKQK